MTVEFSIAPGLSPQNAVEGSMMNISYLNIDFDHDDRDMVLFDHCGDVVVQQPTSQNTPPKVDNAKVQLVLSGELVTLRAGNLTIPLIRDQTPVLRFDDGVYIFPGVSSIGGQELIIDFRAYDIPTEYLVSFESVVRYYAVLEVRAGMVFAYMDEGEDEAAIVLPDEPVTPEERKKHGKCEYVVEAGVLMAQAIQWGGGVATNQMKAYADKKRCAVDEAEVKGDMDPKTVQRWRRTETATDIALQGANLVTKGLEKVIGKGTEWVGTHGAKMAVDENGKETKRGAALRGAGAGLTAWNIAWEAAEESGIRFLKEGERETSDYCNKVYGPNGAEAATYACQSAAKASKAGYKIGTLGRRQIAKKSAKQLGKNFANAGADAAHNVKPPPADLNSAPVKNETALIP